MVKFRVGGVDEKTGQIVLDLLLELTNEAGKTLIMATHSPAIVPLADRVMEMHGNQLIERNAPLPEPEAVPAGA